MSFCMTEAMGQLFALASPRKWPWRSLCLQRHILLAEGYRFPDASPALQLVLDASSIENQARLLARHYKDANTKRQTHLIFKRAPPRCHPSAIPLLLHLRQSQTFSSVPATPPGPPPVTSPGSAGKAEQTWRPKWAELTSGSTPTRCSKACQL